MSEYLDATVRQGAYLPHWTKAGATYAVRFRLADSVPQNVLRQWKEEKKEIALQAAKENRTLTKNEQRRLHELSSEKIEQYLQVGYGACHLKHDNVAEIVAMSLRKHHEDHYRLYAWCIMPNHVHVVLEPLGKWQLQNILETWKGVSARKINRLLKRTGTLWQQECFDHLIRNDWDFHHAIEYTWKNPEEAGLKNWKWRWKAEGY